MEQTTKTRLTVKDLGDEFTLLQDSQDIAEVYENFGLPSDEQGHFPTLFVEVLGEEYGRIYGIESFTPYDDDEVMNFREWYEI